jgi:hypothetical protein
VSKAISEEMGIHKEWMVEAKEMTVEKLPEFVRKLTEDYRHDYGTICHAIAAAAVAAAWAVERSPTGGISGFQAGCVMWEIIRGWGAFGGPDSPLRIQNLDDLLYPQYRDKFTSISKEVWLRLKAKAAENLEGPHGTDNVRAHWQSIVDGRVPFGFSVSDR